MRPILQSRLFALLAVAVLAAAMAASAATTETAPSQGDNVLDAASLPDPFAVSLQATRPHLPEPHAVTLVAERPEVPDPFVVTLEAHRDRLSNPFPVTLEASRPDVPDPFVVTLEAARPDVPDPFAVTLEAARADLPDPFAVTLEAVRANLPDPFPVTLQATRPTAERVAVPNVLTLPLDEAVGLVAGAGLNPLPDRDAPADALEEVPGRVYMTVPEAGTELEAGKDVAIRAYGPRPQREVPGVRGLSLEAARGRLREYQFIPTGPLLGNPATGDEEPGTAEGTVPVQGSALDIFSEVAIRLFAPREPEPEPVPLVTIPDLRGATVGGARGVLGELGFLTGDPTLGEPAPAEYEAGRVAATIPPAGTTLEAGAEVMIQVFGPHATAQPEEEPPAEAPPAAADAPVTDGTPEPQTQEDRAEKWIGTWELASTNPRIVHGSDRRLYVLKQQITIIRIGDTVQLAGGATSSGAAVVPTFTETGISIDMVALHTGSPIEIRLSQEGGHCQGTIRSAWSTTSEMLLWTTTCRRL